MRAKHDASGAFSRAAPGRHGYLALRCGHADDQVIEIVGDANLTRQARAWTGQRGQLEHAKFHRSRLCYFAPPGCVNVHMTSGASAGTSALCDDARYVVVDSAFHDRDTDLNFLRMLGPIVLYVNDPNHIQMACPRCI